MVEMLRRDILPVIPEEGSVGASGDLTPLSYVAAAMMGERDVMCAGRRRPARDVYAEQGFAPMARRLGWRPEFRWERLAGWAQRHGSVRVVERRAMPPLGHFSLIRFERVMAGTNGQGRAADGRQYVC